MDRVKPNEIRVVVEGWIVQKIGLGKSVPNDLLITLTDYHTEGSTPETDPRISQDGYGDLAFCAVLHRPGKPIPRQCIDEDGNRWI